MKTTFISFLFIVLALSVSAQGQLPSASKSKAAKKAAAEVKMYESKGFKPYLTNQSIKSLLTNYYENSFRKLSPGERVYISSQGMAKAGSSAAAFQQAIKQAKHRIPGLLQMYFNSWISADKRTSEKEKSALINAVNQSGKALTQMVNNEPPDKTYRLLKTKSGKYHAVVRILFNQLKLRNLARKEIINTALSKTGWPKSKIDNYLRF